MPVRVTDSLTKVEISHVLLEQAIFPCALGNSLPRTAKRWTGESVADH